jgi:hypothetical protein
MSGLEEPDLVMDPSCFSGTGGTEERVVQTGRKSVKKSAGTGRSGTVFPDVTLAIKITRSLS